MVGSAPAFNSAFTFSGALPLTATTRFSDSCFGDGAHPTRRVPRAVKPAMPILRGKDFIFSHLFIFTGRSNSKHELLTICPPATAPRQINRLARQNTN